MRELENMVRRLAALHPEDTLTAAIVEAELAEAAPPPTLETGKTPRELSEMVERYLAGHFASYGRELPPPGLYDRVLQHVERPLLMAALAATRGNQIRAAALLGPQPQYAAQEDPRSRYPGVPHPGEPEPSGLAPDHSPTRSASTSLTLRIGIAKPQLSRKCHTVCDQCGRFAA